MCCWWTAGVLLLKGLEHALPVQVDAADSADRQCTASALLGLCFAGQADAATSGCCAPTVAVVSKQGTRQQRPAGSAPADCTSLQEPLLSAAAAAAAAEAEQETEQQQQQQQQQQLGIAQLAAVLPCQQQAAEPHWCAVVDDAAEASKHDTTAAAAATVALQELPRHLTCKTISPMASLEDGMSSAVNHTAELPAAAAAAASPAAAWEANGWHTPSASVAAAAAAVGELSAFHSSFLDPRSFTSPMAQSPFSSFSSYWHSGQHYSALPLLSHHAQQHTPSSVLWTPPGNSVSSFQQQQQQQQLVVQGRSLASSCWAALRRLHCYVVAMFISFFVPCFIFPAMLSPEAGSVRLQGAAYASMLPACWHVLA
jgi:hypothetical protein